MTTKDWYKVTSNAWRRNKNPSYSVLYIEEEEMLGKYQGKKYKLIYTTPGGKRIIIANMKSRPTILKIAKIYRRKH